MVLKKQLNELKHQKRIHGLNPELKASEIAKLKAGVPIQKIIGFINFDNLVININRHVFIPRYETEEVVKEALKYVSADSQVLDLCCGSGYIGLTIKQKTGADVTLSDAYSEAIAQTTENARINNLKVRIIQSDLFKQISGKFDVIISNPPYMPRQSKVSKSVKRYEPQSAIFGGKDGNLFYKHIINELPNYVVNGGYVIFEIAPHSKSLLIKNGFKIMLDINQKERIAIKQVVY